MITAISALLWVLPKCFDTLSIYALCWPAPPFFFGSRCPHARGVKVPTVIAPRAQSYPERQRSWGIGSSPSVSRGHVGPAAACTDGPATHRLRIPDPTGRRHPGATEVPGPYRRHHHRCTTDRPRPCPGRLWSPAQGSRPSPPPRRCVPPRTPLPAPGGKPGDGTPTPPVSRCPVRKFFQKIIPG